MAASGLQGGSALGLSVVDAQYSRSTINTIWVLLLEIAISGAAAVWSAGRDMHCDV
jgi:hypothetical protein